MSQEVIAYLMPGQEAGETAEQGSGLQALVRREDGSVALEDVEGEAPRNGEEVTRFQQAEPITDPETKEVIGYEMKPINGSS